MGQPHSSSLRPYIIPLSPRLSLAACSHTEGYRIILSSSIYTVQPNIASWMSPERPPWRSPIALKPYTREAFAPSPPAKRYRVISSPQDPPTPKKEDTAGQLGFPTRAQFCTIEEGYIDSLTPRRQGKALISQALFDRIWHVLHNDYTLNETAQFRFWVRKMFVISEDHTLYGEHRPIGREVLLHDGLLVAVREHIYELLCYYHGIANHGGRDKTCAYLRRDYTWVPKDLVAQFVKVCPTCIIRRCGRISGAILSAPSQTAISPALPSDVGKCEVKKEDLSPVLVPLKLFPSGTDCPGVLPGSLLDTPITPLPRPTLPLGPISVNQLNRRNPLLSHNLNTPLDVLGISLNKEPRNVWKDQSTNYYRNTGNEYLDTQPLAPTMSYAPALGRTHTDPPDVRLLFKPGFEDALNFTAEDVPYFFDGQPSASNVSPLGYPTPSPPLATGSTGGSELFDPFMLGLTLSMDLPSSGGVSPISRKDVFLSDAQANGKGVSTALTSIEALAPAKLEARDSIQEFRDLFMNEDDLNMGLLVSGNSVAEAKDNNQFWGGEDGVYGNGSGNNSPESSVHSDASGLFFTTAGASGSGSPTSINTPVTPVYDKTGNICMFGLSTGGTGGGVGLGNVFHDICFDDFEV